MTLGPTLDGGLKLVPEDEREWLVLLEIAADGSADFAKRFAGLMDEDSMWEDIVVPDLQVEFSAQRTHVFEAVKKARVSKKGELLIGQTDADLWYGALNQARLTLESQYHFGPREFADPDEINDPAMRSAFLRDEFYLTLQSMIMRFVMED